MILVTVGTNEATFDRLLEAVGRFSPGPRLVVQHGPSRVRPRHADCVDFLPYEELAAAMREADTVITHAGVGSVMTALSNGRRPIVVPRLARYGEAVDDHQVSFGRRLASTGLVRVVEDLSRLEEAVADETASGSAPAELGPDRRLVGELRTYLANLGGYSR